ncbi:uncharacterized protein LOC130139873 isoform X2 [Syzygium oleosum]|uniref:uncharacterized protein LOC130139873 isoform X2 n=1 Tax=Syzygium oleosum TaxID=219896 RepID=UPI0024BB9E52|nr:uncharacterized protein LOC130139873 isoform X2 [Syzygium oleosum]
MEGGQSNWSNDQVASSETIVSGEQDFDEDELKMLLAWLCTAWLHRSMHMTERIRDNVLTGPQWVSELLHGHSDRVYEAFRMEGHVFLNLCGLLKSRGWLADSRYVRVDEQVAMFLLMICHKNSNRALCERFQRSGETVSKYFAAVLKAVLKLAKEIIVPPSFDVVLEEIRIDPKFNRYFKGCVGAIDGTHIHATVPEHMQPRFRGKYYAVDSGYASSPGFLTPFKGERYHIPEFRRSGGPTTAKELFNHRHSSLRNIIERSFAALKNRFFVLRQMPPFKFEKQTHIVIACCAIHNYIIEQDRMDKCLSIYGDPDYVCEPTEHGTDDVVTTEEGTEMNIIRKRIANKMARDNHMPEIP